jgi:hypothetical protein
LAGDAMKRLRVKNWAGFQHYRTRRRPWIKLHANKRRRARHHVQQARKGRRRR